MSPRLVERKLQAPEFTVVNEERSNVPFCQDRPKAGLCHSLLEVIPVYWTPQQLSFEDCFSLPRTKLNYDWFLQPLSFSVEFLLIIDLNSLFFFSFINHPPYFDPQHKSGLFIPGLWELDVAELFIKQEDNDYYQEFNLNPLGAWWSQGFSTLRKPEPNFKIPQNVSTFSTADSDSWSAGLQVPLHELLFDLSSEKQFTASFCAILGCKERSFICSKPLMDQKPDFHKYETFLPPKQVYLTKSTN